MAVDAKDIGELQKALNDAAGKASVLWTTFITFELYLAIAFGSVTHRNLFLEDPIKLPVLNVDLPLVGFFVVVPTVLVIFHFYVFLQLLALAQKAKVYESLLRQKARSALNRQYLRQRLDSFLVLQFLAGPAVLRNGFTGFSLRRIAWLTLVSIPVLILLQAQVTFLPYHREWVVWLQRVAVLIDLAVIWYFWDRVRSDDEPFITRVPRATWPIVGAAASVGAFLFSVSLATFPGERVDEILPNVRLMPTRWLPNWSTKGDWTSFHELLFAGEVDEVSGRPSSPFSNRLVLTDQSFVDPDKLDKVEISRSFRGRDLRNAVLNRADLRKADFTGAMLDDTKLEGAKLQSARFGCTRREEKTERRWPDDGCTWLQRASLDGAELQDVNFGLALTSPRTQPPDPFFYVEAWRRQDAERATTLRRPFDGPRLQGISLRYAKLHRARFEFAELRDVSFEGAELQGARLDGAQLQGAKFDLAHLQGASLNGAELQGAHLNGAQLQGAFLAGARLEEAELIGAGLQGAYLNGAQLQGSTLNAARLQGASLVNASLRGAVLSGVHLHAASLERAQLQGANLSLSFLYGASLRGANLQGAKLLSVHLQGALLDATLGGETDLQATILGKVFVWRSVRSEHLKLGLAQIEANSEAVYTDPRYDPGGEFELTPITDDSDIDAIVAGALDGVEDEAARARIRERLAVLRPSAWPPERDVENTSFWKQQITEVSQRDLAAFLATLGCAKEGSPYVARSLIWNERITAAGPHAAEIEARFLDPKECPGASDLTDDNKRALHEIVEAAKKGNAPGAN
jgi:uncharacterized protein YjbI with pentapeptide repeats